MMFKCLGIIFGLLAPLSVYSADITIMRVDQAPEILADSDWMTSADGKLSVILGLEKTTFRGDDVAALNCYIRNNSDKNLEILKPFGDDFYAIASGLKIIGPEGVVKYTGPQKEYALGANAFVKIMPKMIVSQPIKLPKGTLENIVATGIYAVRYNYNSPHDYGVGKSDYWTGLIESKTIVFYVEK